MGVLRSIQDGAPWQIYSLFLLAVMMTIQLLRRHFNDALDRGMQFHTKVQGPAYILFKNIYNTSFILSEDENKLICDSQVFYDYQWMFFASGHKCTFCLCFGDRNRSKHDAFKNSRYFNLFTSHTEDSYYIILNPNLDVFAEELINDVFENVLDLDSRNTSGYLY